MNVGLQRDTVGLLFKICDWQKLRELAVTYMVWYTNHWKYFCSDHRGSMFSERLANCYQSTWHHIPEDSNFSYVTASPWRPEFDPGLNHVGFVVVKVALRQGFLQVLWISPVYVISISARYINFIRLPLLLYNLGNWQCRSLCFMIVIFVV
jgi:hypothetical protein